MKNKNCPEKFLKAFNKALSHFPELKDNHIIIYETKLNGVQHTLRAYPPLVTLHWSKEKWVYPIVINKNNEINISFNKLNFEEQVGLLSHELSHILTYIDYSVSDVIRFSTKYALNKEFVKKIEKETDMEVIKRNLGLNLLSARIALYNFRKNKKYKEVEDTYLTKEEIIYYLKKYPKIYSKDKIDKIISKEEKRKKLLNKKIKISFSRKIKHTLKTIFGFIPEFIKMFYVITIKKIHLKT